MTTTIKRNRSTRVPSKNYSAGFDLAAVPGPSAAPTSSVTRFFSLKGWMSRSTRNKPRQEVSAPVAARVPTAHLPSQQRAAAAAAALSESSSSLSSQEEGRFEWDRTSQTSQSSLASPQRTRRKHPNVPDIVFSDADVDYSTQSPPSHAPDYARSPPFDHGFEAAVEPLDESSEDEHEELDEPVQRDVRRNTITQAFYQTRLPSIRVESGLAMEDVFAEVEARYTSGDMEELRMMLQSRKRNHGHRPSYSKRSSSGTVRPEKRESIGLAYMRDSMISSSTSGQSLAALAQPASRRPPPDLRISTASGELPDDEYSIFSPRVAAVRVERLSRSSLGSPFSGRSSAMPEVVVQPATPIEGDLGSFINSAPPKRSSSRDAVFKQQHGSPSGSLDFDSPSTGTPPLSPDASEEDIGQMLDELQRPHTPYEQTVPEDEGDADEEVEDRDVHEEVEEDDERFADAQSVYASPPRPGLGLEGLDEEEARAIEALSSPDSLSGSPIMPSGHGRTLSDDSINSVDMAVVGMCERVTVQTGNVGFAM